MKGALAQKVTVRDFGELKYFLGMQVIQDVSENRVWIGQPRTSSCLPNTRNFQQQIDTDVDLPAHYLLWH